MAKVRKPRTKVTLFVNEYDVPMLELKMKPRNVYISVKKAQAILATNDDPNLITEVHKYGRDLFQIAYGETGRGFTVGQNKINAILDNAKAVAKAIA